MVTTSLQENILFCGAIAGGPKMEIEHRYVLNEMEVDNIRAVILEMYNSMLWMMTNEPMVYAYITENFKVVEALESLGNTFDFGIENSQ